MPLLVYEKNKLDEQGQSESNLFFKLIQANPGLWHLKHINSKHHFFQAIADTARPYLYCLYSLILVAYFIMFCVNSHLMVIQVTIFVIH